MANGGVSESKLDFAYWYVTNKMMIRNILLIIFIVIAVILLAINSYLLITNLIIDQKPYDSFLSGLPITSADYENLRLSNLPQAIIVGQIMTYADQKNFDIVIDIANPNELWWASFDYQIDLGDGVLTEPVKSYILPAETKKILALNIENGNNATNLIFNNLLWYKEINFAKIKAERNIFLIEDKKYITAEELGLGDKIAISRVQFNAINKSPYNYRQLTFSLYLMSKNNVVAVGQLTNENFYSGQKKNLEVTFFQNLPNINNVLIIPEVNYLDPSSFLR